MSDVDRFNDKIIVVENGCWEFTASGNQGGYGHFWFNDRLIVAHRVAWMITFGEIPDGLLVLHECDNRRCVRPDHLFLGTHQDNSDDKIAKGRINDRTGSNNSYAKLNETEVAIIKKLLAEGKGTSEIGRMFRVQACTISDIKFGRTWKHV